MSFSAVVKLIIRVWLDRSRRRLPTQMWLPIFLIGNDVERYCRDVDSL
jgi:hypothetical protein